MHDAVSLHAVHGRCMHLGREPGEVEAGDRLLVDYVGTHADALSNLAVEFRAFAKSCP